MSEPRIQLVALEAVGVDRVASLLALAFGDPEQHDEWLGMLERETESGRASTALSRVLLLDGEPTAACVVNLAPDARARIGPTGVRPAYRRQGLARRLLEDVLSGLRSAGAAAATLEVAVENVAARALYGELGFSDRRGLRTLVARRSTLRSPGEMESRTVERISAAEALAICDDLHFVTPAYQRGPHYLASFEVGVIAHAVRSDGAYVGAALQRGRAVLDIAARDADPAILSALSWACSDVAWQLRLINVVDDDPNGVELLGLGFETETEAVEMGRTLRSSRSTCT